MYTYIHQKPFTYGTSSFNKEKHPNTFAVLRLKIFETRYVLSFRAISENGSATEVNVERRTLCTIKNTASSGGSFLSKKYLAAKGVGFCSEVFLTLIPMICGIGGIFNNVSVGF